MTYFRNVLINIPYSVLMFGIIALKLFGFENSRFLLVIPAELITALLCTGYILLVLRVRFSKIIKLIPALLIFSILLIGTDFLLGALDVCKKFGVVGSLLLFSAQYFLFSGIFVMFFRHTLTERKERLLPAILRNLPRVFITLIFSWSVFFILVLNCVLFVNNRSGKYSDVFVPKHITEIWEPRLVLANIAVFIPICNLSFLAMHIWMFPDEE